MDAEVLLLDRILFASLFALLRSLPAMIIFASDSRDVANLSHINDPNVPYPPERLHKNFLPIT